MLVGPKLLHTGISQLLLPIYPWYTYVSNATSHLLFKPISSARSAISSINAHHMWLVKLIWSVWKLFYAKKYFFAENLLDEKKRLTVLFSTNFHSDFIQNWGYNLHRSVFNKFVLDLPTLPYTTSLIHACDSSNVEVLSYQDVSDTVFGKELLCKRRVSRQIHFLHFEFSIHVGCYLLLITVCLTYLPSFKVIAEDVRNIIY